MIKSVYSDGSIEPRVNTAGGVNNADDALLSIAISLKRIADTLEQIEMTLRGTQHANRS